ncbi:MAG TPA: glycosyltransferase, partial [Longimicrobium sp.]|nr:glycosyltransferase [Longimicrobium sp.]
LLYVCDFNSIHSRTFIEHFAARRAEYEVCVISTRPAEPMEGVRLHPLAPAVDRKRTRAGMVGALAYRVSLHLPGVYKRLRGWEDMQLIRGNRARVHELAGELAPDVIHGFRVLPESVLAAEASRACPGVPLFVSTWGQDFVAWTTIGKNVDRATREVMAAVDHLLPDNRRDERLARAEFGLSPRATTHVMPATGGLDVPFLRAQLGGPPLGLKGRPTLLSMRGYENIYVKVRVLLEALRLFLGDHPDAHLYLDGPAGHAGAGAVRRWIGELGLERSVTMVHLSRVELFRHMQACDLNVSATTSDGLPMSLLESLWFGQVPVVKDHESTIPPLSPGVNGIAYPRIDPRTIADAWREAMRLVPAREARTRANRELIARDYERSGNLRRVEEMYRGAVAAAADAA